MGLLTASACLATRVIDNVVAGLSRLLRLSVSCFQRMILSPQGMINSLISGIISLWRLEDEYDMRD